MSYTVKRTRPAERDGEVIVSGVDMNAALDAHESAEYNAVIIDDEDGEPACMRGIEHACECHRCAS